MKENNETMFISLVKKLEKAFKSNTYFEKNVFISLVKKVKQAFK